MSKDNFQTAGPYALVGAIIRQAAWDVQHGKPTLAADAWEYFEGPDYRHHLELLGLPGYRLPVGVTR
jgi:hypothetical protein